MNNITVSELVGLASSGAEAPDALVVFTSQESRGMVDVVVSVMTAMDISIPVSELQYESCTKSGQEDLVVLGIKGAPTIMCKRSGDNIWLEGVHNEVVIEEFFNLYLEKADI